MVKKDLGTYALNTWCPGCGNFAILSILKEVLSEERISLKDTVVVTGIGCHAKIVDYVNMNSFYSLHGRAIPAAEGIKIANPNLKVIVFAGDGDSYGEGLEHLLFAAKRNIDITVIIHNNRVYGLTVGQYTPTSPLGFVGKSTPKGTREMPINPLRLTFSSGATFVARGYSSQANHLKRVIKEGIRHKGFSHIDVLQVCATFFDKHDYYDKHIYKLKNHPLSDPQKAFKKIIEWDYNSQAPIALGVLYKRNMPTFEEKFLKNGKKEINKERKVREYFKKYI